MSSISTGHSKFVRVVPRHSQFPLWVLWGGTGGILIFVFLALWRTAFPSLIELGFDPSRYAMVFLWMSLTYLVLVGADAAYLRRILATTGWVEVVEDRVNGQVGAQRFSEPLDLLKKIQAFAGGGHVRLTFDDRVVTLLGLWVPDGWRRGFFRWKLPDGSRSRMRRRDHPLIAELLRRRPTLRLKASFPWLAFSLGFLAALVPPFFLEIPMDRDTQKMMTTYTKKKAAEKAFDAGHYASACKAYRELLPEAKHSVYLAQDAALIELYCSDMKSALAAAVGFDDTLLWPGPFDSSILARIRIAQGRFQEADRLTSESDHDGYERYLALAKQGRERDADEILRRSQEPNARGGVFLKVLLLRHQGKAAESNAEARLIWNRLKAQTHPAPLWFSRPTFAAILTGDPQTIRLAVRQFAPAYRELPGFRREILDFTERETPELADQVRREIEEVSR